MSTQISGHHISPALFNLEDVVSASLDHELGWTLTTAYRERIAADPNHDDAVVNFLGDRFLHANANLWINPALIIGLFDQGAEIVVNCGHGLTSYDARQVDVERLINLAGLTQVTPHAFVQLKVARSLDTGHLIYGLGDAVEIPEVLEKALADKLRAQGWIAYKRVLVNPARLLIRDGDTVSDDMDSQYNWGSFDGAARTALDTLPWQTRGDLQINPQALHAVEHFRTLQTPKLQKFLQDLVSEPAIS